MAARLIVHGTPRQTTFIEQVIEASGLKLVAVTSLAPDDAGELGRSLDVPSFDEVKRAVADVPADVFWQAAPSDESTDRSSLNGLTVVTSEPVPGSLARHAEVSTETGWPRFLPRFRESDGYIAARENIEAFGAIHAANLCFVGAPVHGSLFARLFDAMDCLGGLMSSAETVDAVLCGSARGVPERLIGFSGHLTASLRFDRERGASITLSDRGGPWSRRLQLFGEGGRLTIDDDTIEWTDPEGAIVEPARPVEPSGPAILIARQIARMLEHRDSIDPPPAIGSVLAHCEAARLSCLTGQSEALRRVAEIGNRV